MGDTNDLQRRSAGETVFAVELLSDDQLAAYFREDAHDSSLPLSQSLSEAIEKADPWARLLARPWPETGKTAFFASLLRQMPKPCDWEPGEAVFPARLRISYRLDHVIPVTDADDSTDSTRRLRVAWPDHPITPTDVAYWPSTHFEPLPAGLARLVFTVDLGDSPSPDLVAAAQESIACLVNLGQELAVLAGCEPIPPTVESVSMCSPLIESVKADIGIAETVRAIVEAPGMLIDAVRQAGARKDEQEAEARRSMAAAATDEAFATIAPEMAHLAVRERRAQVEVAESQARAQRLDEQVHAIKAAAKIRELNPSLLADIPDEALLGLFGHRQLAALRFVQDKGLTVGVERDPTDSAGTEK